MASSSHPRARSPAVGPSGRPNVRSRRSPRSRRLPPRCRTGFVSSSCSPTWCQLRRGELLGLRRRDIDAAARGLTIERSRTFTSNGASLVKEPKSAAGRRTLAIPTNVLDAIQDHLERFTSPSPDAFVFTGRTGMALTAGVLQNGMGKELDLRSGGPISTSTISAIAELTFAAATGATTAELMHRAGHASANAALRYQHATKDRDSCARRSARRALGTSRSHANRACRGERIKPKYVPKHLFCAKREEENCH